MPAAGRAVRLPLYETPPQAEAAWDEPLRRDPGCARCKLSESKPRTVCMKPEGQPGGLLVISDYPGKVEDATGRPLSGPTGKWLRERLARHWKGPIAYDNAVRCFPAGEEVDEKHADACRPYTAKLLADVRPTRILTVGTWATYGFLGRKVPALIARRAYGWWIDGETYPDPTAWVPVFALPNPVNALRNKFYARTMEADLKWALTCERPSTDFVRAEVTYVRDEDTAQGAYLALSQAPWVSFDTETAGLLFDSDFEVVCVTFYGGDDLQHGWAFDQESWKVPGVLAWARKVLAHAVPKTGHNTKYDSHAVYLDPALRTDIERSWWGDTRLFRKLLDGDVDARLAVAAELVGMGGHKAEALAAETPIKADLSRMASQVHGPGLTPKGKPRKAYVPKVLRPEQVSRLALENIHAERAEPMTYVFKFMEPRTRARYNARDALSTAYLQRDLGPRVMAKPNLARAWGEIMLPASKALARMERRGVGASREATEAFAAYLDAELEPVSAVLGHYPEVNWNSPVQVAKLLFGKLGLPSVKETDSGADSTDAEVLEALKDKHPVVRALLRHRKLTKLQGTYARGLLANIRADGRIHPSFLVDGAGCLPAGELVLTARGYIVAEDVRVGDTVLSHRGVPRPVVSTQVNQPSPIYRVELSNGVVLRTTPDHRYYVGGEEWVRADALTVGRAVQVHSAVERWAPVEGWELYEVSSWGRVRGSQGYLTPQPKGKWGHLKVCLARFGAQQRGVDRKDFTIHRLVMQAFGPPPDPARPEVRHLNGLAWDNTVENLAWGSSAENRRDASIHGAMSKRNGAHPQCVLTDEDAATIRAMPRPLRGGAGRWHPGEGVSDASLAEWYGVKRETIRDIRSGKRWLPETHITGKRAEFAAATVRAVSVEPPEATYGATVAVDHSHVTGGVVTHNTGRLSCQSPNLQNIPSGSRDTYEKLGKMARDCFVAPRGRTLVELDYSQIELRVAAHIARDPVMIATFQSGMDFHLATAKMVAPLAWGVKDWDALPPELKKKYRTDSKVVNFGVHYGKTPHGLADELGITVALAEKLLAAILGEFKVLRAEMQRTLRQGHTDGGVMVEHQGHPVNWRPLPALGEMGDDAKGRRINAENALWNTRVQGQAAHLTTASLWPLTLALEARPELEAFPVLTVHDSLMVECREEAAEEVARIARQVMTRYDLGGVPIVVDAAIGPAWGSLVELKEPEKQAA